MAVASHNGKPRGLGPFPCFRQEMRGVTGQPACASPKWQRSEDGLARLESGGRESCIGQKLEINRSHTHAYPPCPFGSALHCMKVLRRYYKGAFEGQIGLRQL